MSQIKPFLLGAITGAGLLYLFDPAMGRRRRTQATQQAVGAAHRAQDQVVGTLDLATDKAMGAVAEKLPEDKPENAQTLIAKVRSEALGDDEWSGYTINVDAADGVVTLRGQVDTAAHRDAIAEAVEDVTGVKEVENLLHLPGEEPRNVKAAKRASRRSR